MKRPRTAFQPVWILFAIILGYTVVMTVSRLWIAPEKVPWRTDVAAAADEAQRAGKPMLLYFTATWCGPCQMMKEQTWNDATVEAKLRGYMPIKIDADQYQSLVERYQVGGYPAYLVTDAGGKVMKRNEGFMTPGEFVAWIGG